jgi:glycine cleavage system regulatory protein
MYVQEVVAGDAADRMSIVEKLCEVLDDSSVDVLDVVFCTEFDFEIFVGLKI